MNLLVWQQSYFMSCVILRESVPMQILLTPFINRHKHTLPTISLILGLLNKTTNSHLLDNLLTKFYTMLQEEIMLNVWKLTLVYFFFLNVDEKKTGFDLYFYL